MRRYSIGAFFTLSAALSTVIGLSVCLMNVRGGWLALTAVHPIVVRCLSIAAALEMLSLLIGMRGAPAFADLLPVAASALLTFGAAALLIVRLEILIPVFAGGAAENGALALDESAVRCLLEIGFCLAAVLSAILGAFFDVTVEGDITG